MSVRVRVVRNDLGRIADGLAPKTSTVVRKTLFDIEAGAKERTPPRVDTGAMLNGWTTEMTGEFSGFVYNAVAHHIYNELGTVNMSAHPMLFPAAEDARQPFYDAMRKVVE